MSLSPNPRARMGAAVLVILLGLLLTAVMVSPNSSLASDRTASAPAHAVSPANLPAQPSLALLVNNFGDAPDNNVGDGICNTSGAVCTLRAAIQESNAVAGDDTISFLPSPFSTSITLNSALPDIDGNLTINGPGANSLTVIRNPAMGTPDFGIFRINSGKVVTISGLAIIAGQASNASASPSGGGIWNAGTLTVNSCRIVGNRATGSGGGIFNQGVQSSGVPATLTINSSSISGNFAEGGGGGVVNNAVNATSTVTINNSSIEGNRCATSGGGGVRNGSGSTGSLATLTINNSNISNNGNTATVPGSGGGAIYNIAVFDGATSTVTINNTTISDNFDDAAGSGGAIYHVNSGSGSTATLTINNGTIANNRVTNNGDGGGIFTTQGQGVVTVMLRDTIVAANEKSTPATANDISGPVDPASTFNLIGAGGSGGLVNGVNGNQVGIADPLLGPLANNGGPTSTRVLLDGSPAIDAGNSALTTDQRGQVRPLENLLVANAAGGNGSDIGAVEMDALFQINSTADADDGACTAVGTGNGCTLREAITRANADPGPEIILFASALTASGPATITLTSALPLLSSETTLTGPGSGLMTIQRSSAGGTAEFRIFSIDDNHTVSLSGLTVTNGRLNRGGAGIANEGTLSLLDVTVSGNHTADSTGGDVGNPGGGIYNNGSLTMTNCTVTGNSTGGSASNFRGGDGGGIYSPAGNTLTVVNSTISGNQTGAAPGGPGGYGGGIYNRGLMTLTNSTVSGNQTASGGAGGGIRNEGNATLTNTTISGNQTSGGAEGQGGGVYNGGGLTIISSTITNNTSGSLGGGGGIFYSGVTFNLRSTIVAGNLAGGPGPDISGNVTSQDYNLIGNTSGASFSGSNAHNVTNVNARLASLANNGGPTQTHALLMNSPALDAGDNLVTGSPLNLSSDQRGFARQVDGHDTDTTATVDIGAFEAQVSLADISGHTTNEDQPILSAVFVGGSITSVTATSSNTTLVPNDPANLAITGSGSVRNLIINPAANEFGTSTITVTVNGPNSQSVSDTFVLTVDSVNDAPSFTKGPNQTANNNAGAQSVTGWATNMSPGPPNESSQSLTFFASNNNNGLFSVQPAISSSGTLTYEPATNGGGTAIVTVVVQDSGGTFNGGQNTSPQQTFNITIVPAGGFLRFASNNFVNGESAFLSTITVERTGDMTRAVTVDYATGSGGVSLNFPCSLPTGAASPKCDFTAAVGTLKFAAGESSKTFNVLHNQDSYLEGTESVPLTLSNATNGSALGTPSTSTLTLNDDPIEPQSNPIDDAENFVRQHYHDFLNREPDASGLAFWTNQITSCGSDQQCIELKRINVSAAFFLSIEFQQTGYLVERIYKAAYGTATATSTFGGAHQIQVPVVRLDEFLPDTQQIGLGVVVGAPGAEELLENNKQQFLADFMLRPRFTPQAFPLSLTPAEFVDKLNLNAGNPLSQSERDQLVAELTSGAKNRAQVLRAVAEDSDLNNAEKNRAFVLMQYFGYLRRNPNDPQDTDYSGYEFWLIKLNQFNGNFINADMVKAFITSGEYRNRFGN